MQLSYRFVERFFVVSIVLTVCLVAFWSFSHNAKDTANTHYVLATGSKGGTFYPVGIALSTLVQAKLTPLHKISLNTMATAGSGENIALMHGDKAHFSIINGLYGLDNRALDKERGILAVSMLWPNVEQFIVKTEFVDSGNMADLKKMHNRVFSIGKEDSGTERSGMAILNYLDIAPDNFAFTHTSYSASSYALQDDVVQGMNIPSGVPTSAITRSFASMGSDITMLSFTDEQLATVNQDFQLWFRYVIPANTYPGQTQAIRTIAQPNFLAVSADVRERDVYLITRAIYQNMTFLNGIHRATREMSIERAFENLSTPLHPGAARFYQEMGMNIPDHLLINPEK